MKDEAHEWLKYAAADLSAAEDMLATGHPSHCIVLCQQAVEKAIKALIAETTGETPPKIHDLVELARAANLSLPNEQEVTLAELTHLYIESRYPVLPGAGDSPDSDAAASDYLGYARGFCDWIRDKIVLADS